MKGETFYPTTRGVWWRNDIVAPWPDFDLPLFETTVVGAIRFTVIYGRHTVYGIPPAVLCVRPDILSVLIGIRKCARAGKAFYIYMAVIDFLSPVPPAMTTDRGKNLSFYRYVRVTDCRRRIRRHNGRFDGRLNQNK